MKYPTSPTWIAFALLMLLFAPAIPLVAQTPPESFTDLPFNQTVTGVFREAGDKAAYRFEVPLGQTIIAAHSADSVILSAYCIRIVGPSSTPETCEAPGGGGTGPISISTLFPSLNIPESRQFVEFTLRHVQPDVTIHYSLTLYAVTPQPITLGENLELSAAPDQPFQLYALENVASDQVFTAQIAEAGAGAFLWVANQPFLFDFPPLSDEPRRFPQLLDFASRDGMSRGIQIFELYDYGAARRILVVKAAGRYTLTTTPLLPVDLVGGTAQAVTVSYSNPIQLVRLPIPVGQAATLDVRIDFGGGAFIGLLSADGRVEEEIPLGSAYRARSGKLGPLSGRLEGIHGSIEGRLLHVQIPLEFTRDEVLVEMIWSREN